MNYRRWTAVLLLSSLSFSALAADGAPGPDLNLTLQDAVPQGATGHVIVSQGGNGTDNGNGGDGGNINVTGANINDPAGDYAVGSLGGRADPGRNGGEGGDVIYSDDASVHTNQLQISSQGGEGPVQGRGGDAGDVTAHLNGTYGQVVVASVGGPSSNIGTGGNGGVVTVVFSGTTNALIVGSVGGENAIQQGNEGTVKLMLQGEVAGDVRVTTNLDLCPPCTPGAAGSATVSLMNGAKVGGDIFADPTTSVATIKLAFELASQTEVDAARATLQNSAAHGWITVGGNYYEWRGFSELVDDLRVAMAQNPGHPIAVSVAGSDASPSSPGDAFGGLTGQRPGVGPNSSKGRLAGLFNLFKPRTATAPVATKTSIPVVDAKLRCDDRAVTVFRMSDGSLSINIRLDDGKAYAVGQIADGKFKRAAGSKWRASLEADGKVTVTQDNATLATCA